MSEGRIGILGGTFDPIHLGHVQMADIAISEKKLDKVVFVPSSSPPHKKDNRVLPFSIRREMVEIVCNKSTHYECNDIEKIIEGPSFFVHTLTELLSIYGNGQQLFFILGTDSFLEFTSWKSYQEILHKIDLILIRRRGDEISVIEDCISRLGYGFSGNCWSSPLTSRVICMLSQSPFGISSTRVRELMRSGRIKEAKKYLHNEVFEFLTMHKVYSPFEEAVEKCGKKES